MTATSAIVPMDGSTIYPTGVHACRDDRWFGTARVSSWPADSVVLTVALGEPIPRDFPATPDNPSFAAMLTVPDGEIEAMCAVEATCVWKNVTWVIDSLDAPNNTAVLQLPLTFLDAKQSAGPAPNVAELRSWPGVVVDASGVASARVRPAEMAAVTLQVTPYETQPSLRRRDDLKSTGIPVSSIPVSPWMSAADALHTARDAVSTSRAGGYPVDRIRADRMRDGWRVWAPPPASDDPLGFRLGWAVWYVADDGVMWRSSTSTDFRAASRRMSNQLYQRLQHSQLGIL
ncbi:hypothetical protein AAFP30_22265 [Gordonia sp. CPCC 205515]|uniref:hypothetical protein n=1 Tax=Gordonia sp. CPCC 205515 TaxID=3140791 RepID=UPI003AF3B78F